MALTLRDVVESQTQLRASGARRDPVQKQDAAAASRERFSLDASDQQSALEARSRASAARADAAKAESAKSEASKPPEKSTQTERSSSAKSEPDSASRPEPSKKPSAARAAPSSSQSGKPQAAAAKPDAADTDAPQAATGDAAAAAPEGESAETAVAKTVAEPNVITLPVAPALVAPPPLPVPSLALSGAVEGDAEAGTGAAEASTANAAPSSAHAGSPAGSSAAAKPGFELALADVSAANSGGANAPPTTETAAASGPAAATSSPATAEKAAALAQPQAPTPAAAPVPLGAVPMTIGLRALGASNRFEIRLDPKELGRIDVSIDIDKDTGTVGARLVVDRPETLALLQRDASSLQQALSQTGLDASAGVSLSLRNDQGSDQRNGGEPGANAQARAPGFPDRDGRQAGTDTTPIDLMPLRALRGFDRVDIRI